MSSLYEFGEGILRTHLTWEDLQKECIEIFGDAAVFGPNKSVKNIGDTRGFASKMCLIDPDWKEGTDAPKLFVVKICCQLAMTEAKEKMRAKSKALETAIDEAGRKMQEIASDGIRKGHNSEVNVYNLIQKYNVTGTPAPKVYKAMKFSEECNYKGYMIMEFIEGALNLNIFDNIGVEDVKQALKGLAVLEAASLNFSDEEKESLSYEKFKELYANMTDPRMMTAMMKILKEYSKEELLPKIEKMEKILPEFVDISLFNMGAELGKIEVFFA